MTSLVLLAITLVAAAPAAPARPSLSRRPARASPLEAPAPPRPDPPPGQGVVVTATATRAYLDVGAEDGVLAGAELPVRRAGEALGSCRVEVLAPHHAACAGAGLRAGDTVAFDPAPAPPPPKLLGAAPPEEELERRRVALEAVPLPLVQYEAAAGGPVAVTRSRTVEVGLTHASWVVSNGPGSHREALQVALRDAEVGAGFLLDVDARAERWLSRDAPRFRPEDDTQLYLWQAQLSRPGDALALAAGRVLPWTIPGATIFDGAMTGWRVGGAETRAEAGVFGGFVPDPVTTAPTAKRATGGGYWTFDRVLGKGAALRSEGRIALVRSPELGNRTEGSVTGRVFLSALDLSAEAHLGTGGKRSAGLDAGRLDLAVRPVIGLVLGGGFRQANLAWPQPFDPPAFPGRTREAELFATVDVGPAVRIGAIGGLAKDLASGLDRRWIGPELSLPRLLWNRGGVSLGYLEESGWLDGRSAWVQASARPWNPVRLVLRGSWAHDRSYGSDRDDVGLLASIAADLTRHVGLRLSLSGRTAFDLTGGEGGSSAPLGVTGFGTVFARY
jgi:hypothetical protein